MTDEFGFDDPADMELSLEEQEALANLEKEDPDDIDVADTQYQWDEEFQRHILGMLLNDGHFLMQSLPLIKPNYFTNEVHKLTCRKLFNHFDEYKLKPNKTYLLQEIKDAIKHKDDKTKWRYITEVRSVYDFYVPGIDSREYLLNKITNFAKIQALRTAFVDCLDQIKKQPDSDKTWMKVHGTLREALQVDRRYDMGLEYFQTYEDRYKEMKEEISQGVKFTSGFPSIDNGLVGGGPSAGEIYSWIGLSGTGKSLSLVTAAVQNIARLGKRVLYVSLEMDEKKIAERFDAQFANVHIGSLENRKEVVFNALAEQVADKEDKRLLVIKQFPAGSMDVNMLRAYMQQLQVEGFKPDLVIVDYIGEMKDYPGVPTWESRYRIVRDLRGLATEEDVCIFTAMQPNKSAREAQKVSVIDDDNLADAYGQIRPLDGCWSINQMQSEKEAGIARIFVIKHRHGKSRYLLHVEYDFETLQMREISGNAYDSRYKKHRHNEMVDKSKVEEEVAHNLQNKSKAFFDDNIPDTLADEGGQDETVDTPGE